MPGASAAPSASLPDHSARPASPGKRATSRPAGEYKARLDPTPPALQVKRTRCVAGFGAAETTSEGLGPRRGGTSVGWASPTWRRVIQAVLVVAPGSIQ